MTHLCLEKRLPGPGRIGILWPLVFLLIFSSCGYRFSGERTLPDGKRRICIPVFQNRTMENGAEFIVTNSFTEAFAKRGFVVASNRSGAEDAFILSGLIESMSISTISESSRHSPLERRVYLSISLGLTKKDGKVEWENRKFFDSETYHVASEKPETERNRKKALSALSERLGENVFYMITSERK